MPRLVKALGASAWAPHYRDLTPERLRQAYSLGLRVAAWTVNAEDDMNILLEAGIDSIMTDYPDRLLAVIAARQEPLAE